MILAIETCLGKCSVALLKQTVVLGFLSEPTMYKQSELLLPMIEELLNTYNVDYDNLGYIAVSTGPGSFTGIRIGIATANAISSAIKKKVVGVSCMEAIAYGIPGNLCTTLDAGRNQLYVQKFIDNIQQSPIDLIDQASLTEYALGYNIISHDDGLFDARKVGITAMGYINNNTSLVDQAVPIYIKPTYAKPVTSYTL